MKAEEPWNRQLCNGTYEDQGNVSYGTAMVQITVHLLRTGSKSSSYGYIAMLITWTTTLNLIIWISLFIALNISKAVYACDILAYRRVEV